MPLFEHTFEVEISRKANGAVFHPTSREALQHIGPVLHVAIGLTMEQKAQWRKEGKPVPDPVLGIALLDTGALSTAVDESVCKKLGLVCTGRSPMQHAGGVSDRARYAVATHFPGTELPSLQNAQAISADLNGRYLLLVGRDLMRNMKIVYNGLAGRVEVAF